MWTVFANLRACDFRTINLLFISGFGNYGHFPLHEGSDDLEQFIDFMDCQLCYFQTNFLTVTYRILGKVTDKPSFSCSVFILPNSFGSLYAHFQELGENKNHSYSTLSTLIII